MDSLGCTFIETYTVGNGDLEVNDVITNTGCNTGDADGAIDLTVSGGDGDYVFSWSNGAVTEDIEDLIAGDYSVTVTDASGCSFIETYSITSPGNINIIAEVTNVGCGNEDNGAIDLTQIMTDTGFYTVLWSNGETTESISGLVVGSYTVTITDLRTNCSLSEVFEVDQDEPLEVNETISNAGCDGSPIGGINLTVSGGNGTYSYAWDNGSETQDINGLPAGNYSVTVTDGRNCSFTSSYEVVNGENLLFGARVSNATCNGLEDGSIDLSISGGDGSYTFNWSNGAITEDINDLPSNEYSVTVTDGTGCTFSETYSVGNDGNLEVSDLITDAGCDGAESGAIDLTVSGGSGTYTFAWSNGAETEDLEDLAAGEYRVTVTDSLGCTFIETYAVGNDGNLEVNEIITNAGCNNASSGAIDLTVTGGSGTYTYSWNNGAITEDLDSLAAGNYQVTVTDSLGCSFTGTYEVGTFNDIEASAIVVPAGCTGNDSGSIDLTVSGGNGAYLFVWSNGETTEDLDGLTPGDYRVTITDGSQCSFSETYTVGADGASFSTELSTTDVSCLDAADGRALARVSGEGLFSYQWSNGATTPGIESLEAGLYILTVTGADGCFTIDTATITAPEPLMLLCSSEDASEPGASDGQLSVEVSGGSGSYQLIYTDGTVTDTLIVSTPGTSIADLPAGMYTITITDVNGCPGMETCMVSIQDNDNDCTEPLSEVVAAVDYSAAIGCTFTTGYISFIDAEEGLEFSIDGGATWSSQSVWNNLSEGIYQPTARRADGRGCTYVGDEVTIVVAEEINDVISPMIPEVTDCNSNELSLEIGVSTEDRPYVFSLDAGNNFQNDPLFTGLSNGSYQPMVRDTISGCELLSERMFVLATDDQPIITGISATNAGDCGTNDGSITLEIIRATTATRYRLNGGDWVTDPVFMNLGAGTYLAELTDSVSGCSFIWNVPIVIEGRDAPMLSEFTAIGVSSCEASDGSLELTPVGDALMEYSFDGGLTWQTSNLREGIPAGNVFAGIRYRGEMDCVTMLEPILIEGGFSASVDSVTTIDPLSCDERGGEINIFGVRGQEYSLDGGENWQTDGRFTGLEAGRYTILIRGIGGDCETVYDLVDLIDVGESSFFDEVVATAASGCSGSDGSITVTGTYEGLEYALGEDGTFSSDGIFTDLNPGDYLLLARLTGVDCAVQRMLVTVDSLAPLAVTVDMTETPSCYGTEDGLIFVSASGGDEDYDFNWSNGMIGAEISNLPAGEYQLVVSDGRGCTDTVTVTLDERADFAAVDAAVNDTAVCAIATVTWDLGDLENDLAYEWQQPDGTLTPGGVLTTSLEGQHLLTITAPDGCVYVDSFFVDFADEAEFFVDFLLPERAVINDPTVAIDISWPIPDSIRWTFDDPNITDLGTTDNQQWLEFAAPGVYDIALEAFSGGCAGAMSRQIAVFESRDSVFLYDSLQIGGDIRTVELFPNPHQGSFTVEIALGQEVPVDLFIFDMNGQLIDRRNLSATRSVLEAYELPNLPIGTHTLVVRTENSMVYLRHIKID